MSSSPAPQRPGPRAGWRPGARALAAPVGLTLRARLLAMLMLLLALLCLFIGVVTEVALRQYLVGQTDQRLEGARDRLVERGFGPRYNPGPAWTSTSSTRLGSAGTLGARVSNGTVVIAGQVPDRGPIQLIDPPPLQLAEVPLDGQPHTVNLDGTPYRLLATQIATGDVLVTGLSLEDAYDTLYNLAVVEVAVTLAVLLAAGLGGAALIRLTLRPLRRVAATAGRGRRTAAARGRGRGRRAGARGGHRPAYRGRPGRRGAQPAPRPRRRGVGRPAGQRDAAAAVRRGREPRLRTPLAAIRGTPNWAAGRSPRRPR